MGHCIGVDPYYLYEKANAVGYHTEMIAASRRINDSMGKYIAGEVVKLMIAKEVEVKDSQLLLLGISFKENCADVRNTKVVDMFYELQSYGVNVTVVDPYACPKEVFDQYGILSVGSTPQQQFDAVVSFCGS